MARLIWVTRCKLALGHIDELFRFFFRDAGTHEVQEIGDGIERVVDLVRNRGRESACHGELFVGEKSVLGAAFESDVAKDEDDAGDLSGLIGNGSPAICDKNAGAVLADGEVS